MVVTVQLDVTMCVVVGSFQCFGETFFLDLQDHPSELQVEAAGFSVTLVTSYQTVRHHIPTNNVFILLRTPNITRSWKFRADILLGLFNNAITMSDRLCCLVVRVSGYRYRGLGFDSRCYQILWVVVGLERGPLSLVRSIEELLE